MAKRGSSAFWVTAVAKAGLAASAALTKILELEKEVSRLRHHVSVLSRRNHGMQKELDGLQKGEEGKDEEVASQKKPEPAVAETVAEPSESEEVAECVEESVASSVAPMSTDEDEDEGSEGVRERVVFDEKITDLRDRMSDEDVVVGDKIVPLSGYAPVVEEGLVREEVRTEVPVGPRGYVAEALRGPRSVMVGGVRRGVPSGPRRGVVRRDYGRRMDSLEVIGDRRGGMVGGEWAYHTRGVSARAPVWTREGGWEVKKSWGR